MKKILSYLLVLCLMCSLLPAAVFTASAAEGGNCGENVYWSMSYDGNYVLKIGGTGAMTEFTNEEEVPWAFLRDQILAVEIADTITSIAPYAFFGCTGLSSVTIPGSVNSIGSSAFRGCTGLSSVTIPGSVYSIGTSAFSGCTGLTEAILEPGVKRIDPVVFYGCTNLERVVLPEGLEVIGSDTFADCTKLSYIVIPDSVYGLDHNAFQGCTSLVSVVLGDGITSIRRFLFKDCSSLKYVNIPESVTLIETGAFAGSGIERLVIPASVTEFRSVVFSDCTDLRHLHFEGDMPKFGSGYIAGCSDELVLCYPEDAVGWENYPYNAQKIEYIYGRLDGTDYDETAHEKRCAVCNYAVIEEHDYSDGACVCGELPSDPALKFINKSLSLQSYIAFNVLASKSTLSNYDSWYVVFKRYDCEKNEVVTQTVEGTAYMNNYWQFEYKLNSYHMSDYVTATLYAVKDGKTYKGERYFNSAADYVIGSLPKATSDAHKKVFADLLTYGAKAQIYMGYNVNRLADANLGEYASFVTTTNPTAESIFAQTDKGLTGVTLGRMALGIASSVELQAILKVSSGYVAEDLYAEMVYVSGGKTMTQRIEGENLQNYGGGLYVAVFNALTATDGRTPVEITVYDAEGNAVSETWTYSIASYLDGTALTGDALNTLHALINFYDSAAVYYNQ